jgi:uncharacterized protein (DUF2147 family)
MKMKLFLGFIALALFSFSYAGGGDEEKLIGVWQPSDGRSYIKIDKIGNKFYGRVVWLKEPNDEKGAPRVDVNNPDPSLRSTPLKGYRMLKDIVYNAEEDLWEDGTIYDPKNGTTYDCKIVLTADNQIEVRGYVGAAVFGRTDVWTRLVKKE